MLLIANYAKDALPKKATSDYLTFMELTISISSLSAMRKQNCHHDLYLPNSRLS